MNKMKFMALFMNIVVIFGSCGSMSNTGRGAAIGGDLGTALGTILRGIIGKDKGTVIGATIGTAIGAGTGAFIDKKMDKVVAEAKQIEGAQVEQMADNNELQAMKVTFDSGILFTTGNANLGAATKSALSKSANNVLDQNRDMDVSICGYTDNQSWKNSTVAQSQQENLNLSQERTRSTSSYLLGCSVPTNRIKSVQGVSESDPVASNDTVAGREQDHRVEIYIYASEQMTKDAQAAAS